MELLRIETKYIHLIDQEEVHTPEDFIKFFKDWNDKKGLEGMIAKRPDSTYVADGKNSNFLKIKVKDNLDAVVMGLADNPRSYLLGILDDEVTQFTPFAWITIPKGQRDILEDIVDNYRVEDLPPIEAGGKTTSARTRPELVVEVEGDKRYTNDQYPCGKKQTGKGWSLFEARLVQIRDDKNGEDATTVEDFLSLPKMAGY